MNNPCRYLCQPSPVFHRGSKSAKCLAPLPFQVLQFENVATKQKSKTNLYSAVVLALICRRGPPTLEKRLFTNCLRSPERIDFKLAVLTYRCLHGLASQYLSDYIQSVAVSNRRRFLSSSSSQLVIRRTQLSTVGDRAFPVARCHLWSSLPPDITSASTLSVFRNRLKTHLFSRSFPS